MDALFKTLLWQKLRAPGADLSYHFVVNTSPGEAAPNFEAFQLGTQIQVTHSPAPAGDYAETTGSTRGWTPQAWHRVGALKNSLIQHALTDQYDYLWLIDADVLCDPHTLQSMLDCQMPVVSGVYWTQWTRQSRDAAERQHAGPQVWLRHPYAMSGRGYTESEFRAALVNRQRLQVWGLGANTLIAGHALQKGLHFGKFADLPPGPMSDGEDRHFCMRADALHVPLCADAWPDIWHAYHPDEYSTIPEQLVRLARTGAGEHPRLGDNVSLVVENLEVPGLPPQHVRGRIGQLKLHPELEQAVYMLRAGESRTLKVHFPASWPNENVQNQDFVMRLTLLDFKEHRLPPVIDRELFAGTSSVLDHTDYTTAQLEDMVSEPATD